MQKNREAVIHLTKIASDKFQIYDFRTKENSVANTRELANYLTNLRGGLSLGNSFYSKFISMPTFSTIAVASDALNIKKQASTSKMEPWRLEKTADGEVFVSNIDEDEEEPLSKCASSNVKHHYVISIKAKSEDQKIKTYASLKTFACIPETSIELTPISDCVCFDYDSEKSQSAVIDAIIAILEQAGLVIDPCQVECCHDFCDCGLDHVGPIVPCEEDSFILDCYGDTPIVGQSLESLKSYAETHNKKHFKIYAYDKVAFDSDAIIKIKAEDTTKSIYTLYLYTNTNELVDSKDFSTFKEATDSFLSLQKELAEKAEPVFVDFMKIKETKDGKKEVVQSWEGKDPGSLIESKESTTFEEKPIFNEPTQPVKEEIIEKDTEPAPLPTGEDKQVENKIKTPEEEKLEDKVEETVKASAKGVLGKKASLPFEVMDVGHAAFNDLRNNACFVGDGVWTGFDAPDDLIHIIAFKWINEDTCLIVFEDKTEYGPFAAENEEIYSNGEPDVAAFDNCEILPNDHTYDDYFKSFTKQSSVNKKAEDDHSNTPEVINTINTNIDLVNKTLQPFNEQGNQVEDQYKKGLITREEFAARIMEIKQKAEDTLKNIHFASKKVHINKKAEKEDLDSFEYIYGLLEDDNIEQYKQKIVDMNVTKLTDYVDWLEGQGINAIMALRPLIKSASDKTNKNSEPNADPKVAIDKLEKGDLLTGTEERKEGLKKVVNDKEYKEDVKELKDKGAITEKEIKEVKKEDIDKKATTPYDFKEYENVTNVDGTNIHITFRYKTFGGLKEDADPSSVGNIVGAYYAFKGGDIRDYFIIAPVVTNRDGFAIQVFDRMEDRIASFNVSDDEISETIVAIQNRYEDVVGEYWDVIINKESKVVKKDDKYQAQSEKGKNFGTYDTKQEAKDRVKQMEMFKHMKKNADSENADEYTEVVKEVTGATDVKPTLDTYGLKTYEAENEEWAVTDNYKEVEAAVKEDIKNLLDDLGVEALMWDNMGGIENYLDPKWFEEARQESNESYAEDILSSEPERFIEEAKELKLDTDYAGYELNDPEGDHSAAISDFAVAMKEQQEENPIEWYINDFGKDSINDLIKAGYISFDIDAIVEKVMELDGPGHVISDYDGKMVEKDHNGKTYYLFRTASKNSKLNKKADKVLVDKNTNEVIKPGESTEGKELKEVEVEKSNTTTASNAIYNLFMKSAKINVNAQELRLLTAAYNSALFKKVAYFGPTAFVFADKHATFIVENNIATCHKTSNLIDLAEDPKAATQIEAETYINELNKQLGVK